MRERTKRSRKTKKGEQSFREMKQHSGKAGRREERTEREEWKGRRAYIDLIWGKFDRDDNKILHREVQRNTRNRPRHWSGRRIAKKRL